MSYPFPDFEDLSPRDQQMIRDFDNDPSVITVINAKGQPQEIRTAAEFVAVMIELGLLKEKAKKA